MTTSGSEHDLGTRSAHPRPPLTADLVKARALALGFDLCGIAPVDDFPELRFFREWLARGYAGDMAYLERSVDTRTDLRRVVQGARSVVAVAVRYNTEAEAAAAQEQTALIARYARGDDYHDVLKGRLDTLLSWMREMSPEPFEARAYVDTGPVQERVVAQYAGLGWIGKNTCLINAEHGSWLFLGEIVCSLWLEPDAQALEQCGSCRRCLDACPTGALVDAGVLDARRCISYLTIELRGAIPAEQRAAVGTHVYGCDICQDVCPYNQPPSVSSDPAWGTRPGLDLPRLVDLWNHSDADLRALMKGSAMRRAKVTGLRRNIAVAIGNGGDDDAVAALEHGRDDQPSASDPVVREHVAWAVTKRRGDGHSVG